MNIVRIDEANDQRLDLFLRKSEEQLARYQGKGVFIGESELIIKRALAKGYVPYCFLIVEKTYERYLDIFKQCDKDVLIYEVSYEVFKQLKGYILLRDILCCFIRKEELSLENILKDSQRIVVLEDIMNPTNMGAIFRNAIGFFADGVCLTQGSCDPLYRRAIRTSMGNVFNIDYCYVKKENYLTKLKEFGFKTVALALREDSLDIDDPVFKEIDKLAIILGSEGYGLADKTIKESDFVCKIKMNPEIDSLNVASASGIALWQLCLKNR